MIRRVLAGASITLALTAVGGVAHAQEAPAPDPNAVTLPCALTTWLQNGIRDSADVQCLQTVLLAKGFNTGPVDGWFGPMTEGAVEAFQVSAGGIADGEVGPETATALGAEMVSYTGVAEDPTPEPAPQPARQQRTTTRSTTTARSTTRSSGGSSGVNWDNVARCESGGQWGHGNVTNHVGTFGGGLMIMQSAWRQYGGGDFASTPGGASRSEQIIVAERIAARVGAARAWQCPVG